MELSSGFDTPLPLGRECASESSMVGTCGQRASPGGAIVAIERDVVPPIPPPEEVPERARARWQTHRAAMRAAKDALDARSGAWATHHEELLAALGADVRGCLAAAAGRTVGAVPPRKCVDVPQQVAQPAELVLPLRDFQLEGSLDKFPTATCYPEVSPIPSLVCSAIVGAARNYQGWPSDGPSCGPGPGT